MSEVQEFLKNSGHPTENTPLDPQVAEAGVEYIDDEDRGRLKAINEAIRQAHPDHPGHIPGDIAPIPNAEPSPLSEQQVNGEPIATPLPDNASKQPGFAELTFGALGTTIKSGIASLLHPDAMKDGPKKGVGNTSVSDLPVKQSSDNIENFRPVRENSPINNNQNTEEVKDAA